MPRIYLKQFRISEIREGSFLYCIDFSDQYKRKIQRVGLNDRIFKIKKFYNDNRLVDPFLIEKVFAQDIEPKYEAIMNCLRDEKQIPVDIREDILSWLFFTQFRAPHVRDNINRVMSWMHEMNNKFHNQQLSAEDKELLKDYIIRSSREIHLDAFSDPKQAKELLTTHIETLNTKHWKILKSIPGHPFLTSDNPGFSPNQHEKFAAYAPFHHVMELNHNSIIYFVFSPDYCLEIRPFFEGTPLDVCALNMDIKFEAVSKDYIDYINAGSYYSKYKTLISNSKDAIRQYLKILNQWQSK
ncbi:MAG: DUF4238 domain-containing protein [Flavisolibacter sp.]